MGSRSFSLCIFHGGIIKVVPDTQITHWRGTEALNRPANITIDVTISSSQNDLYTNALGHICKLSLFHEFHTLQM